MGITSRQGLAAALVAGLHKQRYQVIDVPRQIDELSPSRRVVQVIRDELERAKNGLGDYKETFVVWVLSPKKDQDQAEADLEAALYDVVKVLDTLNWLLWTKATRAIHVSGAQAYRIDITLYTGKE